MPVLRGVAELTRQAYQQPELLLDSQALYSVADEVRQNSNIQLLYTGEPELFGSLGL